MDVFAKAAADGIKRTGKPGTYRRANGEELPAHAVIQRDIEAIGEYGQALERRTVARLLKSEIGTIGRHDELRVGDETFRIRGLEADNGYVLVVVVS